jgi:N-acetylmuramoyl-L-alanine amidase
VSAPNAKPFGILLGVGKKSSSKKSKGFLVGVLLLLFVSILVLASPILSVSRQIAPRPLGSFSFQQPAPASPSTPPAAPAQPPATAAPAQTASPPPAAGLNIVVLDPAHGGTDFGARGTGGIHESDIVLEFAAQVRSALESQGFQVIQTRQGDQNPSFDDRSAIANAQRGAIFVTLHIASTGLPGTARVYVMTDITPATPDLTGLLPWDRAQSPFLALSRKLGDQIQGLLAQRFKGSPATAQTASVRVLRTTAAPAVAVEISSVVVENRTELDRMAPGIADAIARGAAAFRPSYIVPRNPGERP